MKQTKYVEFNERNDLLKIVIFKLQQKTETPPKKNRKKNQNWKYKKKKHKIYIQFQLKSKLIFKFYVLQVNKLTNVRTTRMNHLYGNGHLIEFASAPANEIRFTHFKCARNEFQLKLGRTEEGR